VTLDAVCPKLEDERVVFVGWEYGDGADAGGDRGS
jgi:hypothetical protein